MAISILSPDSSAIGINDPNKVLNIVQDRKASSTIVSQKIQNNDKDLLESAPSVVKNGSPAEPTKGQNIDFQA